MRTDKIQLPDWCAILTWYKWSNLFLKNILEVEKSLTHKAKLYKQVMKEKEILCNKTWVQILTDPGIIEFNMMGEEK